MGNAGREAPLRDAIPDCPTRFERPSHVEQERIPDNIAALGDGSAGAVDDLIRNEAEEIAELLKANVRVVAFESE